MWPIFVYMTRDECLRSLRQLELDAYAMLVSALRAQGPLTQEKRKILKELCDILRVSQDRHKCEIRRAVNDEKLNTIAYHMNGPGIPLEDWCQEGRRVLPVLQRISPQTLHPIISDNLAGAAAIQQNYLTTDRKNLHLTEAPPEEQANRSETILNEQDLLDNEPSPIQTPPKSYRLATSEEPEKVAAITTYPARKMLNKNQKPTIVSKIETIPTTSILQKTLSVPISKVTKLNLEKFKIVPTALQVSGVKQNFFTSKTGKKVIPLSQLQMLNRKLSAKGGIKVLPISGKIFGKNITMTRITNQQGLKTSVLQPFIPNPGDVPKIKVENIELLHETIKNEEEERGGNNEEDNKPNLLQDFKEEVHGNEESNSETIFIDINIPNTLTEEINKVTEHDEKKQHDDLASLMEIDPSEFIEPELKEPVTVPKDS